MKDCLLSAQGRPYLLARFAISGIGLTIVQAAARTIFAIGGALQRARGYGMGLMLAFLALHGSVSHAAPVQWPARYGNDFEIEEILANPKNALPPKVSTSTEQRSVKSRTWKCSSGPIPAQCTTAP